MSDNRIYQTEQSKRAGPLKTADARLGDRYRQGVMQKYVVSLFLLFLFSPLSATANDGAMETIGDVRNACRKEELYEDGHRDTDTMLKAMSCMDYVRGAYDAVGYYSYALNENTLCPPIDTTYKQVHAIFLKWANQHPEQSHLRAIVGIFKSLQEVYACKK